MPKTVLTIEEKHQVAAIFRRWRKKKWRIILTVEISLAIVLVMFGFMATKKILWSVPFTAWFIGVFSFVSAIFISADAIKRFAQKLSEEERELLIRLTADDVNEHGINAASIINEVQKMTPQKELLRASQPMPDENLLRASVKSEDVPQEQLLRAANGIERE